MATLLNYFRLLVHFYNELVYTLVKQLNGRVWGASILKFMLVLHFATKFDDFFVEQCIALTSNLYIGLSCTHVYLFNF